MTHTIIQRRALLKHVAAVGTATAFVALQAAGIARAQDSDGPAARRSIGGAWRETVTVNSFPPFEVLITFDAGGGLTASASTDATPGFLSSPVHGAWIRTGPRSFRWSGLAFAFADAHGTLAGIDHIRKDITLAADGDSYAGTGSFSRVAPNDSVLFTVTETVRGTRIHT